MATPEAERVAERVVDQLLEAIAAAADPDDLRRLAEAIKTVMPLISGPGRRAHRRAAHRDHGDDG